MAEPDRDTQPAAEAPAVPAPPAPATQYSLSEAAIEALADVAPGLGGVELHVLLELLRQQLRTGHAIKSSSRELATLCHVGRSNVQPAIDKLTALKYITIRTQKGTAQTTYQVNILETVKISGPVSGPLSKKSGPVSGPLFAPDAPVLALNQGHPGPESGPPPDVNKALTSAAGALDVFRLENPDLDRVLHSKISDFDKETIRLFRGSLHYFMRKFGVDEQDRRYLNTGADPLPPDDTILARFLAVAHPQQLMDTLENLVLEAKQEDAQTPESGPHEGGTYNPRKYGWFTTTALSRICGVHFSITKKAEQQFRLHKRGQRAAPTAPAPPAEQSGLDFAGDALRQAVAGVKKLR